MASITITGSNANAQRLLNAWGLTAGSVAEGEALIKQRTIEWYRTEIERGERFVNDASFTCPADDFS